MLSENRKGEVRAGELRNAASMLRTPGEWSAPQIANAAQILDSAARSAEEGHNGWANYETFVVALWMDGNYETDLSGPEQVAAVRQVASMMAKQAVHAEQVRDGIWTEEQAKRYLIAEALKNWTREQVEPEDTSDLLSSLVGAAFDEVDWDTLADHQLDALREQSEREYRDELADDESYAQEQADNAEALGE